MKKPQLKTEQARLNKIFKKYPYLNPKKNTWLRQHHMDFDYILKLEGDEEALRFLNQFVKEYYNASLQDAEFFTTEEEKKEIYLNNNARNRCSYGRAKAMDNLRPYIEDYDKDKDD